MGGEHWNGALSWDVEVGRRRVGGWISEGGEEECGGAGEVWLEGGKVEVGSRDTRRAKRTGGEEEEGWGLHLKGRRKGWGC
jgi:hypothetical protein